MELGEIWRKPAFIVGAVGSLAVACVGFMELADHLGSETQEGGVVLPCSDFGGTEGLVIATPGGNPATDPKNLEKLEKKNAETQQHFGESPVGPGSVECFQEVDHTRTIYLNPAGMIYMNQYIRQHQHSS